LVSWLKQNIQCNQRAFHSLIVWEIAFMLFIKPFQGDFFQQQKNDPLVLLLYLRRERSFVVGNNQETRHRSTHLQRSRTINRAPTDTTQSPAIELSECTQLTHSLTIVNVRIMFTFICIKLLPYVSPTAVATHSSSFEASLWRLFNNEVLFSNSVKTNCTVLSLSSVLFSFCSDTSAQTDDGRQRNRAELHADCCAMWTAYRQPPPKLQGK